MEKQLPFPVLGFDEVALKIREMNEKWKVLHSPVLLNDFVCRGLSEEESRDLKFAPRVEVVFLQDPRRDVFRGFRSIGRSGVVVFCLLYDKYVVSCLEFRHGIETSILNLPGGTFNSGDPVDCALKEWKEEIGIKLTSITSLNKRGIPVDARNTNRVNYSYMVFTKQPLIVKRQEFDKQEFIECYLIPLKDWQKCIQAGYVDGYSVCTTQLAVEYLSKNSPC